MSTGLTQAKQTKEQTPQWNVQVIKGKVTTRCLWNACKALSIGLLLLALGTTMAIIGYYADQLSIRSEMRGNSTISIKNESRGFHLNNLSYAGPIVMGIGGFIVVAACVMTFEARDNAAKVVPARFKANLNASVQRSSTKSGHHARSFQRGESKRNTGCQTGGGARGLREARSESAKTENEWSPKNDPTGRKAFTAAFVQVSRELLEKSGCEESRHWHRKVSEANLNKSPSAPDLSADNATPRSPNLALTRMGVSPTISSKNSIRKRGETLRQSEATSSNLLLQPNHLQRQALSMDSSFYENCSYFTPPSMRLSRQQSGKSAGSKESLELELGSSAGVSGSQASMALDLHDCQVTLKVKDESASKRSDTARRHQLLRQKPVEEEKEDRFPRCSCIPRFLFIPNGDEGRHCAINSGLNPKKPYHYCSQNITRSHVPKITADFRSQSFSQCPISMRKIEPQEEETKIFCVEYHQKKVNLSSENIRICCEEQLKCMRGYSPSISPHRSLKAFECRVQRLTGSECLIHMGKSPRDREEPPSTKKYPLVRSNATRRKCSQKIEASLSAEEQNMFRGISQDKMTNSTVRSASFSPTKNTGSKSSSSSRNDSMVRSITPPGRSPSPANITDQSQTPFQDITESNMKPETAEGSNELITKQGVSS